MAIRSHLWLGLAVCCLCVATAAADTVDIGKAKLAGTLDEMGPIEITFTRTGREAEKIAVNEIVSIRFEGEPAKMIQIRNAIEAGRYSDAAKFLEEVDVATIEREEVKQDIAYYKALAASRLALSGDGSVSDAGRAMNAFIKDFPNNYHFLQANEVIGDLFAAAGLYDKAEGAYTLVEEQSPWPDYKMRAGVSKGRALLKQNKAAEATAAFDKVIGMAQGQEGDLIARQRLLATVGKATCLAQSEQADQAVTMLEQLIGEADPEHAELHALAFNALGSCHRKAGRLKEARMAFLKVHIVYPTVPEAHAEALANLSELWKELGNNDRSAEAARMLQERYPNSSWSRQPAAG